QSEAAGNYPFTTENTERTEFRKQEFPPCSPCLRGENKSLQQAKRRASGPPLILAEIELLRRAHGLYPFAEAGLVAAGGVLVEDALLDALVHHGNRFAIGGLGGFLLAFGNGLAQGTQRAAQTRLIGAIARSFSLGLTRTFKRRKMVCHILLWSL